VQFPQQKEIYLEVETIAINKAWAIELCGRLEKFNEGRKDPLSFGANLRIIPNIDLEDLFLAFKKSNFRFINIGVESGSERVRTQVLKRYYSNQDIINAVTLARKYQLKVCFFNLMGVPGETVDDFRETVKINRACLPDWYFTSIFFPYPGTDLYLLCKERGILPKTVGAGLERKSAVLNLPDFSSKEIERNFILFDYSVFKGHKPMHKILVRVFVSLLMNKPYLNYLYRNATGNPFLKRIKDEIKSIK